MLIHFEYNLNNKKKIIIISSPEYLFQDLPRKIGSNEEFSTVLSDELLNRLKKKKTFFYCEKEALKNICQKFQNTFGA